MGLARLLPRAEMLIVTTPPGPAANVAARIADMAAKGGLRVAGVVENMHSFRCEHGQEYFLFGQGGGIELAQKIGSPLLAELPFEPTPVTSETAAPPSHNAFGVAVAGLARLLADQDAASEQSCTARLIRQVEKAVEANLGTTGGLG